MFYNVFYFWVIADFFWAIACHVVNVTRKHFTKNETCSTQVNVEELKRFASLAFNQLTMSYFVQTFPIAFI